MRKMIVAIIVGLLSLPALAACSHSSDVVNQNLSNEADQYHVFRQIVVYNGITDKYVLEVKGYCSLGNHDPANEVTYTCKSPNGYVKDIIEKSDNTFVFVHQLFPQNVSQNYFEVTLKPTEIVPHFNLG